MPKNALVILRYGPYSAVGLSVEHRTFRLEGLQGGQRATEGHLAVCAKYTLALSICAGGAVDLHTSSDPDQVPPPLESLP